MNIESKSQVQILELATKEISKIDFADRPLLMKLPEFGESHPAVLVTPSVFAHIIGVTKRTLCNWQSDKDKPQVIKIGSRSRYKLSEISKFMKGDLN